MSWPNDNDRFGDMSCPKPMSEPKQDDDDLRDVIRGAVTKVFADDIRGSKDWPQTQQRMQVADDVVQAALAALRARAAAPITQALLDSVLAASVRVPADGGRPVADTAIAAAKLNETRASVDSDECQQRVHAAVVAERASLELLYGIRAEFPIIPPCKKCGEGTSFEVTQKDAPKIWVTCKACGNITRLLRAESPEGLREIIETIPHDKHRAMLNGNSDGSECLRCKLNEMAALGGKS